MGSGPPRAPYAPRACGSESRLLSDSQRRSPAIRRCRALASVHVREDSQALEPGLHAGSLSSVLCAPGHEVTRGPLRVDRADDPGPTARQSREDEQRRGFHLEVHDALARHVLGEVRVPDGKLRDRATLRAEEARRGGRQAHVIAVAETLGRLDERDDRLVVRDGRVAVVDEPAGRGLEPDGARGDHEIPEAHLRLEPAARADTDDRRPLRDRENLGDHDLDVVRSDTRRDDRHALATVRAGDRRKFAMPALELDVVEQPGDPGGSVWVAGEEEVLGQFAGAEIDVVLPLPNGERDAVIRVRQEPVLLLIRPRLRNSIKRKRGFERASSRFVLSPRSNHLPGAPSAPCSGDCLPPRLASRSTSTVRRRRRRRRRRRIVASSERAESPIIARRLVGARPVSKMDVPAASGANAAALSAASPAAPEPPIGRAWPRLPTRASVPEPSTTTIAAPSTSSTTPVAATASPPRRWGASAAISSRSSMRAIAVPSSRSKPLPWTRAIRPPTRTRWPT